MLERDLAVWRDTWQGSDKALVRRFTVFKSKADKNIGKVQVRGASDPDAVAIRLDTLQGEGVSFAGVTHCLTFKTASPLEDRRPRTTVTLAREVLEDRAAFSTRRMETKGTRLYVDDRMVGSYDSDAQKWRWRLHVLKTFEPNIVMDEIEVYA